MTTEYHRIALLFNANKVYDREVMEGIGEYIQASLCNWDIFLPDDFVHHDESINLAMVDGVIADFDNPQLAHKLQELNLPLVAVGSSYHNSADYPPGIPYVATDNQQLIEMAFNHLKGKGLNHFAFYGVPTANPCHWSEERRYVFEKLMQENQYQSQVYLGYETRHDNWQDSQQQLNQWIQSLPIHTGIIAVTDARARHLLQTCEHLKIAVPEQICIIGIDNEELIQYFSRVSLSSVMQGTKEMGYQAAKLLHRLLTGKKVKGQPILIPPVKVAERASTDYRSIHDPLVMQAMHYIRLHACSGIKVEQVLDYVKTSRSNLEGRFKTEIGKTIHQIIYQEKVERARKLLRSTSISINDISEICGYPSIQYFYSVFKKEYSRTPNEYRLQYSRK
ncbi:XylR family transcriptional regulator [Testudinibacter sp. TR-2022]|uniref:XylR family transcriptional regulator n=1 Tax=Testudinibacter sp. TR-2022 TaxID=2585029 RepID=UPI001118F4F9|nr:DNA-binding transcriptional regulator [Testudinibacter sp. TR-2022]TNH05112.1 DNA-binding transcriptional regulator [Pasteurellaceae bacterium Phil11]TNH24429.1 DNA-binding transcriptional regulator [Testudinibacter sp. TR-2022]TNH26661.1 DNA-binding transcriptional regulator [Testudinibacter sp. TR-2022]